MNNQTLKIIEAVKNAFIECMKAFFTELKQLHIWLVRFRVLGVGVTCFACWGLYDSIDFYQAHYKDFGDFGENSGLGAIILGWLGLIKFGLSNVEKRHEGHGE